ncbi:MAG: PAS domain S-box protein [Pirellulales bacterium]|nr:PAS domain S-box protein [Pirellulales bacterium]
MDLSDLKKAEAALRENERRLQLAVEGTGAGLWDWDVKTGIVTFNERWAQIVGYTLEELKPHKTQIWFELTHPDDVQRAREVLDEHFSGRLDDFECEMRMRHKAGHWVWVLSRGRVAERDADGSPVRMVGTHLDITARKQAEAALRESEERFRIVMSDLPYAVCAHDLDGRILMINNALCGLTGYTEEELLSLKVMDIDKDIVSRQDRERIWTRLERAGSARFESVHHRKDGSTYPAELTVSATTLHGMPILLVATQDITERKRAEEAIQESEERFRITLENLPYAVFLHDVDGRILMVNEASCDYTGYIREELLRMTIADIDPGSVARVDREHIWLQLEQGGAIRLDSFHHRKDGSEYPAEVHISAFSLRGERLLLGFAQDVTQRRRAEQEREKLIAELEAQNAELERFTYTVSHDLKSPLITITGYLGLLQDDLHRGDLKAVKEEAGRIAAAAERMKQLLEELLELSRIGRQVNPPEDVRLVDLLREVFEALAGPIAQRHARVRVDIPSNLPTVCADRHRLLEVFQNLIENAVKYLGDQTDPRIEIGVRFDDSRPVYYVRDNGIGIDPKYHEKVFGLFDQLNPKIEGTGIGLALVRRIVELHGGRIWVESEGLGHGSTFCFTLGQRPAE